MRARTPLVVLAATLLVTSLAGCTMNQLPTYDEVQNETFAAMQGIVDALPEGSHIKDKSDTEPFGCGGSVVAPDSSKGVFFTGHWAVYTPDGYDVQGFIDAMPGVLGDGYKTDPNVVPVGRTQADVVSVNHGIGISLDAFKTDAGSGIDILAISRCAQKPTSPTP